MRVRSHVSDPVFVGFSPIIEHPRKIEMRIGDHGRGEGRYALMHPREAQQVAIALLKSAEESMAREDAEQLQTKAAS
jgi:hypothetical protein